MRKKELVGLDLTRLHRFFRTSLHLVVHACVCAFALLRSKGCMARATWQTPHNVFVRAFVMPPDAAWQKETGKIAEEALSNEVTDALFMNGGFLHGLGRMILSA